MMIQRFEAEYPILNVRQEIVKMQNWWEANPRRRKKNEYRFVVGWLNKSHAEVLCASVRNRQQAQAGSLATSGSAVYSADDRHWYEKEGIKV